MNIIPLSEGSFTIDKTKIFVPFDKQADDLQGRAIGSLLVEIQPFVVITGMDVILLDTGLGYQGMNNLQIYENLLTHNIRPDQVTKVLLSHLHKDHAGGILSTNGSGKRSLNFTNATYFVAKKEFDYAIEKGAPSYDVTDFDYLQESGQLVLLDGVAGVISEEINYEITGGHSPFHTAFWIRHTDEIAFFGGDVAPQLQQMKSRLVAKYDYDGKKSMELRSGWWQTAQKEQWTLLFYHDIKTPTFKS